MTWILAFLGWISNHILKDCTEDSVNGGSVRNTNSHRSVIKTFRIHPQPFPLYNHNTLRIKEQFLQNTWIHLTFFSYRNMLQPMVLYMFAEQVHPSVYLLDGGL